NIERGQIDFSITVRFWPKAALSARSHRPPMIYTIRSLVPSDSCYPQRFLTSNIRRTPQEDHSRSKYLPHADKAINWIDIFKALKAGPAAVIERIPETLHRTLDQGFWIHLDVADRRPADRSTQPAPRHPP
ncbi:hypothetical protein IFT44_17105, partial [Pseudomonas sp. CFBP 13710]|nr:hypothetical protein [Pseudomonas sp. CFBP 13710]